MEKKLVRINNRLKKFDIQQLKFKGALKKLEDEHKPQKIRESAIYEGKNLVFRKSIINPHFSKKTVLTDSHWHYIELLLKSSKTDDNEKALNYWLQAKNFYIATQSLDLVSKPLTTYYCFLNATKALLTYKGIHFDPKHGISGSTTPGQTKLKNEIVKLHKKGVLAGLCDYFEQPIVTQTEQVKTFTTPQISRLPEDIFIKTKSLISAENHDSFKSKVSHFLNNQKRTNTIPEAHSLESILYNLEYIHRAFHLTIANKKELFVPVLNPRFVLDKGTQKAWLEFELEDGYLNGNTIKNFEGFELDTFYKEKDSKLKSIATFNWSHKKTNNNFDDFIEFYRNIRSKFTYIYSVNDLWYYKVNNVGNGVIQKNSTILTLAAMHCLSEMSRYDPNRLQGHIDSKHGWLISEFINKSLYQFVDVISSEISGDDFRATGFRN